MGLQGVVPMSREEMKGVVGGNMPAELEQWDCVASNGQIYHCEVVAGGSCIEQAAEYGYELDGCWRVID